jgi:hypothetical protein
MGSQPSSACGRGVVCLAADRVGAVGQRRQYGSALRRSPLAVDVRLAERAERERVRSEARKFMRFTVLGRRPSISSSLPSGPLPLTLAPAIFANTSPISASVPIRAAPIIVSCLSRSVTGQSPFHTMRTRPAAQAVRTGPAPNEDPHAEGSGAQCSAPNARQAIGTSKHDNCCHCAYDRNDDQQKNHACVAPSPNG